MHVLPVEAGSAAREQQRLHELLDRGAREPCVLEWRYDAPAVVLGCSQHLTGELLGRAARHGCEIVERASGGGAVMAGPWMASVTLLLPASHAWARASLPAGYRAVGEACRRALPMRTTVVQGHRGLVRDGAADWACFASASHGELLAGDGRKVLGLSQVRRRDVVAVCIGLLVERPDWERLVGVWLGREAPDVVRQLEDCTAHCGQSSVDGDRVVTGLVAQLEAGLPAIGLVA